MHDAVGFRAPPFHLAALPNLHAADRVNRIARRNYGFGHDCGSTFQPHSASPVQLCAVACARSSWLIAATAGAEKCIGRAATQKLSAWLVPKGLTHCVIASSGSSGVSRRPCLGRIDHGSLVYGLLLGSARLAFLLDSEERRYLAAKRDEAGQKREDRRKQFTRRAALQVRVRVRSVAPPRPKQRRPRLRSGSARSRDRP